MMRAIELFCGGGLSATGVVSTGANLVGACDLDKQAIQSFNSQVHLLPPVAVACDVDKWEIPDCDLLSAGPVCKAFSPGSSLFGTGGQNDSRNTFPHLFRALERMSPRPSHVLIENSYGLGRFKGYLEEIIHALNAFGYNTDVAEVNCFDYGVPQNRRRVVITCATNGKWPIEKPLQRQGPATVGDCISDPPESDPWPLVLPISPQSLDYVMRDPRHLKKHKPLSMDKPASTVVAVYRKGVPYGLVEWPVGNGTELRLCGPRLAARLQGLPDSYLLTSSRTKALEIIGNGFPPQVPAYLVGMLMKV